MLTKCLEWLKKDEFKNELKDVLRPIMELLVDAVRPYLFLCVAFILLNFFLLMLIFMCVLRRKNAT